MEYSSKPFQILTSASSVARSAKNNSTPLRWAVELHREGLPGHVPQNIPMPQSLAIRW